MIRAAFVIAASILTGCATQLRAQSTQPTTADKELAAKFETLKEQLDNGRGREIVNLSRDESPEALSWIGLSKDNTGPQALQRLKGEAPSTAEQLQQARNSYGRIVGMLEKVAQVKFEPIDIRRAPASARMVIDGELTKAEWRDAPEIPMRYVFPRIEPVKDRSVAIAKLLWDDQYLYASYTVPDPEPTGDPGLDVANNTFFYDCVELFVAPDLDNPAYWEVNLTHKNEVVDRLIFKKPHGWFGMALIEEDIAGMITAVKKTDAGYTAEIAVPWRSLPGLKKGVRSGDSIWGLVGWGDVDPAVEGSLMYYSQVPSVAGFQSVWEFQEWRLK